MKNLLSILALFCLGTSSAQNFKIDYATTLQLDNVALYVASDIYVDGTLCTKDSTASTLCIGGLERAIELVSDLPLTLSSLKVCGDAILALDSLYIESEIVLAKGMLDIASAVVVLGEGASLSTETAESYILGSPGSIVKPLSLVANVPVNTGVGFTFTPTITHAVTLYRTHTPDHNFVNTSLPKSYSFAPSVAITKCEYSYHKALQEKEDDVYGLWVFATGKWVELESTHTPATQKLSTKTSVSDIAKLSIFPIPELSFPRSFSPNGDGINDVLVIPGNKKNPHSRLVLFTPTGKKLHDISPYKDDFDGLSLPDGTYYYIYYSTADATPTQKGAIEILR